MPYVLHDLALDDETGIRFPESLVEKFLAEFTQEGDRVLDPFAGFGTTLVVAERMGRVGIGVEYDRKRHAHIQGKLREPGNVLYGDSLRIDEYGIEPCDFSVTSPPYMQSWHTENPLTNYTQAGDYARYLSGIRTVYARLRTVMKKGARIVLEVSNIVGDERPMTPLAWDIAREVSQELFFEREYIYCHENGSMEPKTGSHSYCLVFQNR